MVKIQNSVKFVIAYQIVNLVLVYFFRTSRYFREIVVYNHIPSFHKFAELSFVLVLFLLIFLISKNHVGFILFGTIASINNIFEFIIFKNVVDYINVFNIGTININDVLIYTSVIILTKKILTKS